MGQWYIYVLNADESKFGQKMLQKMGWTAGKGLGRKEDGATEHVKVKYKQDEYGIGANCRTGDSHFRETQNAFDALLKSLNNQSASLNSNDENKKEEKRTGEKGEKRMGEEQEEKKDKQQVQGRLMHRRKFLKSKLTSTMDSKSLTEILGRVPSPPLTNSAVSLGGSESDSVASERAVEEKTEEKKDAKMVVQKTSVRDYFAMKMAEKKKRRLQEASPLGSPPMTAKSEEEEQEEEEEQLLQVQDENNKKKSKKEKKERKEEKKKRKRECDDSLKEEEKKKKKKSKSKESKKDKKDKGDKRKKRKE